MVWSPQVRRVCDKGGGERFVVGHLLVDEFLEFAASRAPPNRLRAYKHDLKTFFSEVAKDPVEVRPAVDDLHRRHLSTRRRRSHGQKECDATYNSAPGSRGSVTVSLWATWCSGMWTGHC